MINSYTAELPYISLLEDRVSNATKKAPSASTLVTREVPNRMAPGLTMNGQAQSLGKYKQKESRAGNINLGQFQGKKHYVDKRGYFVMVKDTAHH